MRRVGRLLFETDEELNVNRLWDDDGLTNLRATFFEGNYLLPEDKKRKPHTLRAYITALRLFYKFLLARRMYLTNQDILTLTSNDVVLIRSAQELTEGWLKSLAKSVAFCTQDLHQVCTFALFRAAQRKILICEIHFHFRKTKRGISPWNNSDKWPICQ